ncbi:bifunctional riboflavin kinase/FAD synthetase [Sporosalibacterium faouarense]|uniref:bifunctional riboflavin kinase/FAD synthetase n=1 Tax=Sporosalibacterium faouarense TaxID=516123 RepID=UPI00141CE686|nr:bifunctional riboflavin kinase/FAD synthetase [Sporosalibacterium faouarense]MTI48042.1 bifunctional riboflavin kinase/FAD synthetase [Bacillota bacterium]
MDIITDKGIKFNSPTAIALGRFDGIHLGHQALINKVLDKSNELGLSSAVFTFKNLSSKILKKGRMVGCLINDNQKEEILRNIGIDLFYMLDFNDDIRKMSPEAFVKDILVNQLKAKVVVVGFNYRFGYMGKGDNETLKALGKKYGFEVIVINPVSVGDRVVSSTLIRQSLLEGKIEDVNEMLGRPYTLEGTVVNGKKRGRVLGFPTANLHLDSFYVLPKLGVYKTSTFYKGKRYSSISSVGCNPTFGNNQVTVETFLFDFNGDLYDSEIKVIFEKFIREEMKFKSKDDLIYQISKDIEKARAI